MEEMSRMPASDHTHASDSKSASEPRPVRIEPDRLARIMDRIFERLGLEGDERRVVVERLMEASLSGYHSHGVMRIIMYTEGIRAGNMIPGAPLDVLGETVSTVHLDANMGMGPCTATEAMKRAVGKAGATGVGCTSVVNANDIARLGGYVEQPAKDGYIALLMTNDAGGNPCVAPWGATSPLMSTNPMAVGIPRESGDPILIDLSTGVTSEGGLKMLRNKGQAVPEGWLIDGEGRTTTDGEAYFATPRRAAILPLGSLIAGHKGFALSILVDVLTGGLSGAGCSGRSPEDLDQNALFLLVIDPEKFVSRAAFSAEVDRLVESIKDARKAPGVDEIRVPGDGARRERERQLKQGIEIDPPVWSAILDILDELGIGRDKV
ncbi:MAG: Ldh family oxidoreductase [Gemmatimonadetes bacterium]|nr:Ldh family oxidoreductase [Gemmatimonadota bacterium]MYD25198.1 Ldh family oxidoreductase [Gemmatimonadota bacterium]